MLATIDANLTATKEPFGAINIDYATIKKSSIGDILNRPLPINETSYILNNRTNTYTKIKNKLNEAGVPQELIYLAMTESKLAPIKTGSYAGIWQLNAREAKLAGLKIGNRAKDERYDTDLSTDAAIQEFKRLHKIFGRWDLVILAYNCGEGTLQRAIAKVGSDDLSKLFDPTKRVLPRTSQATLQRVLSHYAAVNHIENKTLNKTELLQIAVMEQLIDNNTTD